MIELIRRQIKTCGKSRYRISADTGIKQNVLFRIINGGSCRAETADILLRYFGYAIVKKKGKR
jgi:hypothetical protein